VIFSQRTNGDRPEGKMLNVLGISTAADVITRHDLRRRDFVGANRDLEILLYCHPESPRHSKLRTRRCLRDSLPDVAVIAVPRVRWDKVSFALQRARPEKVYLCRKTRKAVEGVTDLDDLIERARSGKHRTSRGMMTGAEIAGSDASRIMLLEDRYEMDLSKWPAGTGPLMVSGTTAEKFGLYLYLGGPGASPRLNYGRPNMSHLFGIDWRCPDNLGGHDDIGRLADAALRLRSISDPHVRRIATLAVRGTGGSTDCEMLEECIDVALHIDGMISPGSGPGPDAGTTHPCPTPGTRQHITHMEVTE